MAANRIKDHVVGGEDTLVRGSTGDGDVQVEYDGHIFTCTARYYGRIARDTIQASVEKALREEVGRMLMGKPEFKKAIHKMALEKLGEALLRS